MSSKIEKTTADQLNHLVKICISGKQGYEAAMENVSDITMKEILIDYSSQRASFAADLRAHVRKLGFTPEDKGLLSGLVHRIILQVKGVFSKNDCKAILLECINAEGYAIKTYSSAIRNLESQPELKFILERQLEGIVNAYSLLKASHEMLSECTPIKENA